MNNQNMENEKYPSKSGYIAIIGCPNVGKSTLLNFLLGENLAIVTPKPQTTRNKILGIRTEKNAQMLFLDTPGVHSFKTKLNRRMTQMAIDTLLEADVVLFVVDATKSCPPDEEEIIFPSLKKVIRPVILLLNKIDISPKDQLLPLIERYNSKFQFAETFPLSALTGDNTDKLIPVIVQYLPKGPHYYPDDALTDKPERFIVAEIIREKIINLMQQELPYSTAVRIESFEENSPGGLTRIAATILVVRESQKGIIIGKQGSMLKKIGQYARQDIEQYLKTKVFLQLWVKVSKDWPDDDRALKELGY